MTQAKPHTGKLKVERAYYRNGRLREESHSLGSVLHGQHRIWHPNGRLATEEFYEHGLLHGVCRQWNQRGKLLGSYEVKNGTGIQREWFQNGRLQLETSTVAGKFTGRTRVWLQDGTLVSEQYAIENRNVSSAVYAAAAAKHPDYPRYPAGKGKVKFLNADEIEQLEFQLQIKWLLAQKTKREAQAWLEAGAQKRSLGFFKHTQARQLIQKIFDVGALQIFAVNIYPGKNGGQFCDTLLMKLPSEKSARQTIRRLLVKQPAKLRAGVLPVKDNGEEFLFASFV